MRMLPVVLIGAALGLGAGSIGPPPSLAAFNSCLLTGAYGLSTGGTSPVKAIGNITFTPNADCTAVSFDASLHVSVEGSPPTLQNVSGTTAIDQNGVFRSASRASTSSGLSRRSWTTSPTLSPSSRT